MYTPDAWVIVKLTGNKLPSTQYRVLAGWYGGYGGSDCWKLNSGITKIEDCDTRYEFHGASGSVYSCIKDAERFTGLMSSIYAGYVADNNEDISIEHIPMSEFLSSFSADSE